jgi:hypothetical protein
MLEEDFAFHKARADNKDLMYVECIHCNQEWPGGIPVIELFGHMCKKRSEKKTDVL